MEVKNACHMPAHVIWHLTKYAKLFSRSRAFLILIRAQFQGQVQKMSNGIAAQLKLFLRTVRISRLKGAIYNTQLDDHILPNPPLYLLGKSV